MAKKKKNKKQEAPKQKTWNKIVMDLSYQRRKSGTRMVNLLATKLDIILKDSFNDGEFVIAMIDMHIYEDRRYTFGEFMRLNNLCLKYKRRIRK